MATTAVETKEAQATTPHAGAQIPLQSFQLPEFPPEASQLQALTLTYDLKPEDYSKLLSEPLPSDAIHPSLPSGIETLTLELFSLGYPAPFLTQLGKKLSNLKSLTVYSQLIDGATDSTRKDAGEFFNDILTRGNGRRGLRELHLLDVFSRPGFMSGLGGILEDLDRSKDKKASLRFLEISYTYRGHSDSDFLTHIPGDELPTMLVPSLVAACFRLTAPPILDAASTAGLPDDPADVDEEGNLIPGKKPEGIIPLQPSSPGTKVLFRKLTGETTSAENKSSETESEKEGADEEEEQNHPPGSGPGPTGLKMLDSTLYTLDTEQLGKIMNVQKDISILSVSLIADASETWKTQLIDALRGGEGGTKGKELEIVEIVGVPSEKFKVEVSSSSSSTSTNTSLLKNIFPSSEDMAVLSSHCPELESFRMTILRAPSLGAVEWNRLPSSSSSTSHDAGEWTGGIVRGSEEGKS
ncbi:hypothetical protein AJ80_06315 [Polytolypa hystricis UAMH7299]|uniref:Uncharacterized protein n=1 Tax=Polytolypa hystricis (strain UAMH7299) TaxID=1447883 RepID=A0A2B7XW78_POLH7|nr:hypothetical protein AJ80_06315 [Polytolypa hystricis UAMH7299]